MLSLCAPHAAVMFSEGVRPRPDRTSLNTSLRFSQDIPSTHQMQELLRFARFCSIVTPVGVSRRYKGRTALIMPLNTGERRCLI